MKKTVAQHWKNLPALLQPLATGSRMLKPDTRQPAKNVRPITYLRLLHVRVMPPSNACVGMRLGMRVSASYRQQQLTEA